MGCIVSCIFVLLCDIKLENVNLSIMFDLFVGWNYGF